MDIELIRKLASNEVGRRFLEEAEVDPSADPLAALELDKVAAADEELLKIAADIVPEGASVLETYEALGGKYKQAFGTPMFQMNPVQTPGPVGGSPAAVGAGAMKPPTPTMAGPKPGAGMKPPGMGGGAGGGQGMTNPMQQASTPKIPGTSGVKTGMAKVAVTKGWLKSTSKRGAKGRATMDMFTGKGHPESAYSVAARLAKKSQTAPKRMREKYLAAAEGAVTGAYKRH